MPDPIALLRRWREGDADEQRDSYRAITEDTMPDRDIKEHAATIAASWLREAGMVDPHASAAEMTATALVGIGYALLALVEAVTRQDTSPASTSGPGAHNPPDR